jgi:hypothetical protein
VRSGEVGDVGDEERELLLAAEQEALRVLSEANDEAGRLTREAADEAVALLLKQQEDAAVMLQQAHAASEGSGSTADVEALLESHRAAAELLAAAEEDVAARLTETRANAAVDVLMAGHREAAAILLDAWMRVTEGRPADR